MKNLKILILLSYYERSNMVRNALNSILNNNKTYENWELAFIDDGSIEKGKPVVEEILKDHLDKVKFYDTNDSIEQKFKQGGVMTGKFFNEGIKESDADICILLMDDDLLYENYLFNLNKWFNENPDSPYSCSDLIWFVSGIEIPSKDIVEKYGRNFGQDWCGYRDRLELHREGCGTDMSDMAWNIECNKEGNIWFPYPDLALFDHFKVNLWKKYGEPRIGTEIREERSTHFYAVYRSRHEDQLTKKIREHKHNYNIKTHYEMKER